MRRIAQRRRRSLVVRTHPCRRCCRAQPLRPCPCAPVVGHGIQPSPRSGAVMVHLPPRRDELRTLESLQQRVDGPGGSARSRRHAQPPNLLGGVKETGENVPQGGGQAKVRAHVLTLYTLGADHHGVSDPLQGRPRTLNGWARQGPDAALVVVGGGGGCRPDHAQPDDGTVREPASVNSARRVRRAMSDITGFVTR